MRAVNWTGIAQTTCSVKFVSGRLEHKVSAFAGDALHATVQTQDAAQFAVPSGDAREEPVHAPGRAGESAPRMVTPRAALIRGAWSTVLCTVSSISIDSNPTSGASSRRPWARSASPIVHRVYRASGGW